MNTISLQGIGAVSLILTERCQFPMGNRIHDEYSSDEIGNRLKSHGVLCGKHLVCNPGCLPARTTESLRPLNTRGCHVDTEEFS